LRAPVADERVLPPLPHIPTSYLQLKNLDKIHGMMRNYALAALANAAATDRAMLQSVLQDLEKSESVCSRCGHSDSCADMDVAYMIRGHLKGDASAPADEPPGCPTYVCRAAQADGVLCANDECDRANGVRPASAPVADERAIGLFREALAWGCVYGPKLKKDQWERMRDETAQQFSQRLAALISPPVDEGELRTAFNEWIDKTDFIQQRIASGALPVKYLGWHRADVMRDLIDAALASAPVAGEA
ncbi:hypothetical protein ACOTJD_31910, partial [Achromobacter xylosoxidans]